MIDLIKKGMLAGLGATVTTKEKLDSVLDDLVKRGKISREEAEQTAGKIVDESRKEYGELKTEMQSRINEMFQKNNLVTRDQLEALEARVSALEEALSRKDSV